MYVCVHVCVCVASKVEDHLRQAGHHKESWTESPFAADPRVNEAIDMVSCRPAVELPSGA